jgi:hypothetical protein
MASSEVEITASGSILGGDGDAVTSIESVSAPGLTAELEYNQEIHSSHLDIILSRCSHN